MIKPISSVKVTQTIKKGLAPKANKNVARKVVNVESSKLKGISKTPIRLAEQKENIGFMEVSGFMCAGAGTAIIASELTNMM